MATRLSRGIRDRSPRQHRALFVLRSRSLSLRSVLVQLARVAVDCSGLSGLSGIAVAGRRPLSPARPSRWLSPRRMRHCGCRCHYRSRLTDFQGDSPDPVGVRAPLRHHLVRPCARISPVPVAAGWRRGVVHRYRAERWYRTSSQMQRTTNRFAAGVLMGAALLAENRHYADGLVAARASPDCRISSSRRRRARCQRPIAPGPNNKSISRCRRTRRRRRCLMFYDNCSRDGTDSTEQPTMASGWIHLGRVLAWECNGADATAHVSLTDLDRGIWYQRSRDARPTETGLSTSRRGSGEL